jgi:lysine-specific demethylase 3
MGACNFIKHYNGQFVSASHWRRARSKQASNKNKNYEYKVRDWPESRCFAEVLPDHLLDYMSMLPLRHMYTGIDGASLNMATKFPEWSNKPDLGPKLYIATGHVESHDEGDSVTVLHEDLCDAVNTLVHMGGPQMDITVTPREPSTVAKLGSSYNGAGAVWNIWACQPGVKKVLCDYLLSAYPATADNGHPIYNRLSYVSSADLISMASVAEGAITPWHFEQYLDEAVFIPAGCPHQVRNLTSCVKVASDFLSPEGLCNVMGMAGDFRDLALQDTDKNTSPTERFFADKMQASLAILGAAMDCHDALIVGEIPSMS